MFDVLLNIFGYLFHLFYLYEIFKVHTVMIFITDGDEENRTLDPLLARQVLSQLSYAPILKRKCSLKTRQCNWPADPTWITILRLLLRKEVIQPHLPIRLPCYDFTPVIAPTLDGCAGFGCE